VISNRDDDNQKLFVFDGVDDAKVAGAHSPEAIATSQPFRDGRARLVPESIDPVLDLPPVFWRLLLDEIQRGRPNIN